MILYIYTSRTYMRVWLHALHDVIRMHRHPAQGNIITYFLIIQGDGNHIYA